MVLGWRVVSFVDGLDGMHDFVVVDVFVDYGLHLFVDVVVDMLACHGGCFGSGMSSLMRGLRGYEVG